MVNSEKYVNFFIFYKCSTQFYKCLESLNCLIITYLYILIFTYKLKLSIQFLSGSATIIINCQLFIAKGKFITNKLSCKCNESSISVLFCLAFTWIKRNYLFALYKPQHTNTFQTSNVLHIALL